MMNLFKSLLPLCILLLSGYLQQEGIAFYKSIDSALKKNITHFAVEKGQHSVVNPVLSNTKEKNNQNYITDIEEKENELSTFKKNVSFNTIIKTAFYTQLSDCISPNTQLHLFFFKLFTYCPFYKSLYLRFAVMRI
jgi:hypothetical protein